ncbi:MAG: SDR family NAD(P)-dependent oxidoreductase, partial [Methylobacter sp.]
TPAYWVEHIRKPVRFADSIATLKNQQFRLFLELGPNPVLLGMARHSYPDAIMIPSLRQQVADDEQYLRALGALFVQGLAVDWNAVYPKHTWQALQLPTYPFQRQRFWISETRSTNGASRISRDSSNHPLLGYRLRLPAMPNGEVRYEQTLNDKGYIQDHRVFQQSVLPAAAYIEMALAAASKDSNAALPSLKDISIQQALVFSENQDKTVQLVLTQTKEQPAHFEIYSLGDNEPEQWTFHAAGNIASPSTAPVTVDIKAIRAEFEEEISIEDFYRQCRQRGIDYGPDFQVLQSLSRSKGQALGSIQLPERLSAEAARYHIHPVLLDACFQVLIATLTDSRANETWLPVGLDRFELYRTPASPLWCRALIHKTNGQSILQADLTLMDAQGEIIGMIDGFKAKQAAPSILLNKQLGPIDPETWLYGVDWRTQGLCSPHANAALLASPTAMSDVLNASMAAWIRQSQLEECGAALNELDKLCVDYALAAFRDMGKTFQADDCFSTLAIADDLSIIVAHRQLLERTLEMLADAGILHRTAASWKVLRTPTISNPQQAAQALGVRYPQIGLELDLVERCGSALARVLQGRCDPLQELLFPGGDGSALAALYRDPPGAQAVGAVFRQALLTALERLPQRCGVRILEIGAGTGGASSFLLPHLQANRTEYVFTDISPAFTLQAQTTFAAYPFIEYKTLDIEKDPQAQGFKLHDYDVIVASNVLHATEDLARTLKHTRSLLAPGGLLLLLEGTAPQNWIDLIFGMTSGWWRFSDKHLRPSHPLLPGQSWCEALHASGFQQAASIDCTPIHQSIIMAQADTLSVDKHPAGTWLIFADAGGTGARLAEYLSSAGSTCILVYPGDNPGSQYQRTQQDNFIIDPYQASHYQRLLDELGNTTITYCVHLWSLDTATPSNDIANARLGWETLLHLVQAINKTRHAKPPRLVLLTRGAVSVSGEAVPGLAASPLWGMGKSIALEHPELHCIRIDLDADTQADEIPSIVAEITADIQTQAEDQIAFRGEQRLVPRLVRRGNKHSLPQTESYRLGVPATGSLDELAWQPAERRAPDQGEVEIQVHAAGLNFKDVLLALHRVPAAGPVLGIECTGVVVRTGPCVSGLAVGDAVLAMAPGSFSRYLTVPTHTVAALPEGLSFEEAATLPIAFLTAAHALEDLAKLQAGERVLIHAATGGVGLAAIQLAQRAGAEVFATASESKWDVLRALGVKHIMNSRTLDFADEIRRLTDGEGVDVVLNSLRGEFTSRSLALLRSGGRFLEIGITDLRSAAEVAQLAPGAAYHAIDLMRLYQENPSLLQTLLQRLMGEFSNGQLKPLPHTVFAVNEAETAFRTMQQANHTGKLVLSFDTAAMPFCKDASYLISGGLGDLGLLVAAWMAKQGAGHLVLAGRRGITPAIEEKIHAITQAGAKVSVFQTDISNSEQVSQMLAELDRTLPPLRGVIHAAGVLDDGVLSEQTPERYAKVLAPKLDGAWQLHCQTQTLPLDFFILFSSATSLLGSVGQSNHVSANAFLDALAHDRLAHGLPTLSINWGAWSEIGYAARVQAGDFLKTQGMGTIDPRAGLAALERVFHSKAAQVGVVPIDWPTYLQRTACSGYLADFRREFSQAQSGPSEEKAEFRQLLESTPLDERHALLTRHVASQVAVVLGFPALAAVDRKQGFFDMGMDSLTSVELRNRLRASLNCALPSTLAFDFPSVAALVDYLEGDVLGQQQTNPSPQTETSEDAERKAMEQLTEEEAEAKLLKELDEMGFSL